MKKTKVRQCKKCGKPYIQMSGGIVIIPQEQKDAELCEECRKKRSKQKTRYPLPIRENSAFLNLYIRFC